MQNYPDKHMPGKLQQARGSSGTILGETFWTQGSGGTLSATRTHVREPSISHWEEAVPHIFPLSSDILEIFGQCPGGKMKSRLTDFWNLWAALLPFFLSKQTLSEARG